MWAAAEARSHGRGGIAAVARASGMAENTIRSGLRELERPQRLRRAGCVRPGAGRKRLTETDPTLLDDLERLVGGRHARRSGVAAAVDGQERARRSPARLRELGHRVSYRDGRAAAATALGYSLQANRKTKEGAQHPDRDAQFRHINDTVRRRDRRPAPVISVDTKKKELVGEFKNGGREWRPKGEPERCTRARLPGQDGWARRSPTAIYDIADDNGLGQRRHRPRHRRSSRSPRSAAGGSSSGRALPGRQELTITADCGGCNGNRTRLWKTELQRLADEPGLRSRVCHFPPGTSKWNKIEHRLFSFIADNWRGRAAGPSRSSST